MTFAAGSIASSPDSTTSPSSGSLGDGGNPRSSTVTAGWFAVNAPIASAASAARNTWYSSVSDHFIWVRMSSSSSTMSTLDFVISRP
jgi:hypothetical protein